jgi:hypothetical protein
LISKNYYRNYLIARYFRPLSAIFTNWHAFCKVNYKSGKSDANQQGMTKMDSPKQKAILIFITFAALSTACFAPALALQKDTQPYDTVQSHQPTATGYLA